MWVGLRVAAAALVLTGASCSADATQPTIAPESSIGRSLGGTPALVTDVTDGDSFRVDIGGREERVRMIGINAPESGECFGAESRQILSELIAGETVVLVADLEPTDQYGRMLAYVYRDGLFVNEEVASSGAVLTRSYPPNTSLQRALDDAETGAMNAQRGMWATAACGGDEQPTTVVVAVIADAPGRDDENLNGEYVVIENVTGESISLTGWTIKDESSVHRYRFPDGLQLEPGARMVVLTGCGDNTPGRLYWCSDGPVWDNQGDTAFLVDDQGAVRHRFTY